MQPAALQQMYHLYILYVSLIALGCIFPNGAFFSEYIHLLSLELNTWFIFMPVCSLLFFSAREAVPSGGWQLTDGHCCSQSHLHSYNISVIHLCLSIGQTSPVKSLKPVSKNISFPISSLLFFPWGLFLQFNFKAFCPSA